ncbi:MAG: phosphate ABC transporter substrate-binding protein PstS [Cyanobacteria bacterium REEB459]|nr:phosphate ABC transporter substrate-binding protein PstS [Cyanobacteria bacterium REEB459]
MLQNLSKFRIDLRLTASVLLVAGLAACGGGTTTSTGIMDKTSPLGGKVALTGAGASFPAPLYQNWFIELNKAVPDLQVNYQSVGSGAGVEQFTAETVDFGASDTGMKDEEIAKVKRGVILLPMTAGSIVLAYNLPGVTDLKLARQTYVDIARGKITKWNDPKIAAANPGAKLPDKPITFIHRSDGSGTTSVFTKHLSKISPDFDKEVGSGKSVEWPKTGTFVGAKGNEGVTAQIQQTEGSIGYIEYGYAKQNNLTFAALQNKAGKFVVPSDESAGISLGAAKMPPDLRVSVTDPEGEGAYPAVTYTWILAYKNYPDVAKAKAMEMMIEYGLNEGQAIASTLGYVPLPKSVREKVAVAADAISSEYTIKLK